MDNTTERHPDVVSEILKDTDLLEAFSETLNTTTKPVENYLEVQSTKAASRLIRLRVFVLEGMKHVLSTLSSKMQVLALLAEYHVRSELKNIKNNDKKN